LSETVNSSIRDVIDPRNTKLSLMLVFIPLAFYFEFEGSHGPAFIVSMLAIDSIAYQ